MEKTGNAEMIGKDRPATRGMLVAAIAIAVVVALQVIYATTADLRTDEAYYWTLSKEYVLSYLDHPPMVAWMVRFGTAIFGDTNFGARFGGLLAIWVAVAILGDIVWRLTLRRGSGQEACEPRRGRHPRFRRSRSSVRVRPNVIMEVPRVAAREAAVAALGAGIASIAEHPPLQARQTTWPLRGQGY